MTTFSITPKGLYIHDVALPGGQVGPFDVVKTTLRLDQARCAAVHGDYRHFPLDDSPTGPPKVA